MNQKYNTQSIINEHNNGLLPNEIVIKYGITNSHLYKIFRKNNIIPNNYNKDFMLNYKLTNNEHHILAGTVLGDSTVRINGKSMYPNLSFSHCEKQFDYFEWKYILLKNIMSSNFKRVLKSGYKIGSVHYVAVGKSLKCLEYYRNNFYPNGIKTIPYELLEKYFTDLSLFVLYMDDGCKNGKTYNLNKYSFSIENLEWFVYFLKRKFDLEFILRKNKVLYLRYNSIDKFRYILNKHNPLQYNYKI